ncbi:MAG TPA: PAS domain S-box protein [Ktedonobacteraceae bacterium]|nr:PAS domain S-box protein [Ktedonobacteraceae bacterium]
MSDTSSEKQRALKQHEQLLKESEWLFRAVWESAFDAMALSTPDGTVFAANPAYFRLYGFPQEEVIGKHFSIIFPEEQRKAAHELYDYFFQSPTIGPSFVGPIRRADGTERFVESSYNFISHHGQRIAMLSIVRDITERKRVEEALWVSEEKLRIAREVGHMDSWDWDIESNIIRWSVNLDAAFGLVRGDSGVSYETFMELVHPQDRTQVDQEMRRALEEGTDFKVEFRAGLVDDTLCWTRIVGQVLYDEAGKPIRMIGFSMDVPQGGQVEEAR